MARFSRGRIPNISPAQWTRASRLFRSEGSVVEVAQLRAAAGLRRDSAYALIMNMFAQGHAELFTLVYHGCSEAPVDSLAFSEGLVLVPWRCPHCDELVTDEHELRYGLQARVRAQIEFVD